MFQCTVLVDLLNRYDSNIAQHIAINLIVTAEPCLATGMSSKEKADR